MDFILIECIATAMAKVFLLCDISSICSVLGLLATIIIAIIQFCQGSKQAKFEKRQDRRDENRRKDEIDAKATEFIQKYSETDKNGEYDLKLLPLAVIAVKFDITFPYRREMYRYFCCLPVDIRNRIIERQHLDYDCMEEGDFFGRCLKALTDNHCKLYPGDRNWFYDHGKLFKAAISEFKSEMVPSYICAVDEQQRRINEFLGRKHDIYMQYEHHIRNVFSEDVLPVKELMSCGVIDENGDPHSPQGNNGESLLNAYLCCKIAQEISYKQDQAYQDERAGYVDDYQERYFYMEDLFLKSLMLIYVYLLHPMTQSGLVGGRQILQSVQKP